MKYCKMMLTVIWAKVKAKYCKMMMTVIWEKAKVKYCKMMMTVKYSSVVQMKSSSSFCDDDYDVDTGLVR